MAAYSKDEEDILRRVYGTLQAASCPLVDGLFLQETDSLLQLLCSPSQLRTDVLTWVCSSINPHFSTSKSVKNKDQDEVIKEIALFGQELMLCRSSDLDLIRGNASPKRQLQFLEQLLTLIHGDKKPAGHRVDEEMLLNELYAAENLPHLTEMLQPTFDPWPAHIKALHKGAKFCKPCKDDADIATLLETTQSALEQLQSECEFLKDESQTSAPFSPGALRLAAGDLQQLMATFSHVYETDLREYCSRELPVFSKDTEVFQRVHKLLLACNTELEMLNEISEASASMKEEVNLLHTKACYWRRGEKRTLPDQVAELTKRSREFLNLLDS